MQICNQEEEKYSTALNTSIEMCKTRHKRLLFYGSRVTLKTPSFGTNNNCLGRVRFTSLVNDSVVTVWWRYYLLKAVQTCLLVCLRIIWKNSITRDSIQTDSIQTILYSIFLTNHIAGITTPFKTGAVISISIYLETRRIIHLLNFTRPWQHGSSPV